MISACILMAKTFLPRLRMASSSSRMPRSRRPQGLRTSSQTTTQQIATSSQATNAPTSR